ncbi:MAG: restriction system protein [Blastocatellia bacterium]|jgi:restriction endonuclease Mrr|nr:restriction system protein [Blastocatellia bacterium]
MNTVTSFRVGERYTNDQIRLSMDLESIGGIRPALDSRKHIRHVAVITAAEESGRLRAENPYEDRIEGDVLIYTAQGREGDQQITGRNKRLVEQYSNPTPFFGFVNVGKQTYRFLGLLELLRHYQETQADKNGQLRKVWLFEFRIHKHPEIVPIEEATSISATLIAESRERNPLANMEREVEPLPADEAPQVVQPYHELELEELRMRFLRMTPFSFENFIKLVMEYSGFTEVSVTAASGDGGIDINAYVDEHNDFFAGTHVQAQVKRWRHSVGSIEINNFRGALSTTAKGVFVTTSLYTRAAIQEARHQYKPCITLIDGNRLSSMVLRSKLKTDSFT